MVFPAVAEVEDVLERVALAQASLLHGDLLLINIAVVVEIIGIDHADPAAVGEAKLVQV